MIGIVVIGHDVLPESMLTAMQQVVGKQEQVCAVFFSGNEEIDTQRQTILNAIEKVEAGQGVLVFVDTMDSPAGHLTLSIMDKANIEVVGGVNLPMLVHVVEKRNEKSLEDLAELARDEGRKAIIWRTQ